MSALLTEQLSCHGNVGVGGVPSEAFILAHLQSYSLFDLQSTELVTKVCVGPVPFCLH